MKSSGIKQMVILTGSSNEERIDEQIVSEPFRYLVSSELHPSLDDICRYFSHVIALKQIIYD